MATFHLNGSSCGASWICFTKQDSCESHCAVQEDGDEPALDVSFLMASGAGWLSSDLQSDNLQTDLLKSQTPHFIHHGHESFEQGDFIRPDDNGRFSRFTQSAHPGALLRELHGR